MIKSKYFEVYYNPVSKTYCACRKNRYALSFQRADYDEFKKELKKQEKKIFNQTKKAQDAWRINK